MKKLTALFALFLTVALLPGTASAGKKTLVRAEYGETADVHSERDGSYEVGIAFSCNSLYTVDWVKVKIRKIGSNKGHKTYDTYEKNMTCGDDTTRDHKWMLMEYTWAELLNELNANDDDIVTIKVQVKGVGGGKDSWSHLTVFRTDTGEISITKNDSGRSATTRRGGRPMAVFDIQGTASNEQVAYKDIVNSHQINAGNYNELYR